VVQVHGAARGLQGGEVTGLLDIVRAGLYYRVYPSDKAPAPPRLTRGRVPSGWQVTPEDLGMTEEEVLRDPFLSPPEAVVASDAEDLLENDWRPDYSKLQEWNGEIDGMDDPLDAPWRVRGEEIMRKARA
jgi:hypothetical protein